MKIFFKMWKLPLFILIIIFTFIFGFNRLFNNYQLKILGKINIYDRLKYILNKEFWLYLKTKENSKIIKFKIEGNEKQIIKKKNINNNINLKIIEEINPWINGNFKMISLNNGQYNKIKNLFYFNSNKTIVKTYNNLKFNIMKVCDMEVLLKFNKVFQLSNLKIFSKKCNFNIIKNFVNGKININMENIEIIFYIIFSFSLFIFEAIYLRIIYKKICNNSSIAQKYSITCLALLSCLNLNLCLYNLLISLNDIIYSIIFLILSGLYFLQFCYIILFIISKVVKIKINIYSETGERNVNLFILLNYIKLNIIIIVGFIIAQNYFDTNFINYCWAFILLPQILKFSFSKNRILYNYEYLKRYYVCKMIFLFYHRFFKYNFINNNYLIDWDSLTIFLWIIVFNLIFMNLQFILGVNFFIPKKFRNCNEFDYFSKKGLLDDDTNLNSDCIICMNSLKHLKEEKWENIIEDQVLLDYLNKKNKLVMLTPCNHYFHSYCLVTWMNYKMECPYCRSNLPNII